MINVYIYIYIYLEAIPFMENIYLEHFHEKYCNQKQLKMEIIDVDYFHGKGIKQLLKQITRHWRLKREGKK